MDIDYTNDIIKINYINFKEFLKKKENKENDIPNIIKKNEMKYIINIIVLKKIMN